MSKRKRTDSDIGDGTPKLRRMIHDRFSNMSTAQRTMTTITTFHASAAQKSYGQEKRFLCPPPLVRISGGGPLFSTDVLKSQQMKMSVLSDMGVMLQEHSAPFDPEHGIVCFKQLHINSKGKEKVFQLVLSISDQFHATAGDGALVQSGSRGRNIKAQGTSTDASTGSNTAPTRAPWATFYSSPVHIISKPSKKSTRGATPNILNLNSVALFNRINSQTVRTKYLSYRREGNAASSGGGPNSINPHMNGSAENGLTTSSSHWSPFIISLVPPNSHNAPVRFGARIRLSSPDDNYVSHEYIIRKVENKRSLETDFGTQVSQMQKIALLRADVAPNAEGRVCYLSALVERPGPEPITVIPGSTHSTSWRWAEVKTEVADDGTASEVHMLDDYATWMIAGICEFSSLDIVVNRGILANDTYSSIPIHLF
jgi:recombining binding protein (suppressor of hairless)